MSEPRLTEAVSRCYVILNWSRDVVTSFDSGGEGGGGGLAASYTNIHNLLSMFLRPEQTLSGLIQSH